MRSLLVQGCAPGSPAAGALCSWGRGLRSGDEVVQVAGQTVQQLTRAQCVRLLKEPSLIVKMRIRHFFAGSSSSSSTSSSSPPPHSSSYSPSSHHSSLNSYDFLKAEELFMRVVLLKGVIYRYFIFKFMSNFRRVQLCYQAFNRFVLIPCRRFHCPRRPSRSARSVW